MITTRLVVSLLCAAFVAAPAAAQTGALPEAAPNAETANTPGEFGRLASMAHQFQIRAGRLIAEKAREDELAEFARETATRHEDLQRSLLRIAELEGLARSEIPRLLDTPDQERLTELEEAEEDRAGELYLQIQAQELANARALFANYAQKSGRLADHARETTPEIAAQLDRVAELSR